VLNLLDDAYGEPRVFRRGEAAESTVLPGFAAQVDAIFDAQ
jgi:hypothetical protein